MKDSRVGAGVGRTIVVPAFVHRAAMRNKLSFKDYFNFDKVTKCLSSEDIKFWYAVTDCLRIGSVQVGQWPLDWNTARVDETYVHSEYWPRITEVDILEAEHYLTQSNAMTENFYSLHREGSDLIVVVEEGFSLKLQENSVKLEFLKSYLKKQSEILPIYELAKLPLHIQYVSLVTS